MSDWPMQPNGEPFGGWAYMGAALEARSLRSEVIELRAEISRLKARIAELEGAA